MLPHEEVIGWLDTLSDQIDQAFLHLVLLGAKHIMVVGFASYESKMSILRLWREARGRVLRKEYEDVIARMRNANQSSRSAFLNNIDQTAEEALAFYTSASNSERKAFLRRARKETTVMWNSGDWPSALGAAISCLNAESRFLPGEDAAYVKRETDRLIKEAGEWAKNFTPNSN